MESMSEAAERTPGAECEAWITPQRRAFAEMLFGFDFSTERIVSPAVAHV